MNSAGIPVGWDIDGLHYAGLAWGRDDQPVALALHGWMDNALSFSQLGPYLKQRRLIALDMSGHGLSSHRSADATYQLWDDIPQLVEITERITDAPITLIGHSKGAAMAVLTAVALGDQCDRLVLIDGLLPPAKGDVSPAQQFHQFIHQRKKYQQREERIFASMEEFVAARTRYGFSEDNARTLAPRALEQVEQGFRLRADPRLFGASAIRMNDAMRHSYYNALTMPVLALFGESGFFRTGPALDMETEASACISDYRSTILPGSHHLHLEQHAEQVAWRIDSFITTGN
jgi:pimeloyl-ACP methyl ester carboxylesterase